MEKVELYKVIYEIDGHLYRFAVEHLDGGVPYGFCSRLCEWGWLHKDRIQFESGKLVEAKLLVVETDKGMFRRDMD